MMVLYIQINVTQAEVWMDGFRVISGKPLEEKSSLEDLAVLVEFVHMQLNSISFQLFIYMCIASTRIFAHCGIQHGDELANVGCAASGVRGQVSRGARPAA